MSVSAPPRTNLNDRVYETLKAQLVTRELGPGEKVSLHELAATLGVSRSPVHHALDAARLRGPADGQVPARLLRDARSPRRRSQRATTSGSRSSCQAAECAVGESRAASCAASASCTRRPPRPSRTPEWDCANAAFHEHQVDLAGNALLSRFYRELSVNLMMQVIRGGKLEGGSYLPTEHGAIVDAYEAGDLDGGAARDQRAHRHRPPDRARGDRGAPAACSST